jgi:hypothetical protein
MGERYLTGSELDALDVPMSLKRAPGTCCPDYPSKNCHGQDSPRRRAKRPKLTGNPGLGEALHEQRIMAINMLSVRAVLDSARHSTQLHASAALEIYERAERLKRCSIGY